MGTREAPSRAASVGLASVEAEAVDEELIVVVAVVAEGVVDGADMVKETKTVDLISKVATPQMGSLQLLRLSKLPMA